MCLRHTNKDQGYAWVIVILAFFCNTITLGPLWTVGIWTTKFELAFGQSKFYTSLVGSGLNAVYYVTGLIGSILCKRYGYRRIIMCGALIATLGFGLSSLATRVEFLFLTFSLMIGTGFGISFIPIIEAINDYFDIKKNIAFGLSLSGVGCGMLVYPMINNIFLDYFGWRYALLANCSITAFLFLCGLLMCPLESFNEEEESFHSQVCQTDLFEEDGLTFIGNHNNHPSQSLSYYSGSGSINEEFGTAKSDFKNSFRLLKNVSFVLFCLNNFLFFAAMTILWVFLNGYVINGGLGGQSEAGMIYSAIGISNVIGRIFVGILCDHKRVSPVVVFTIGNFFLALNQFYCNFAQTFQAVLMTNVIFGFLSAVGGPLLPPIIIEFLGEHNLAVGYGILLIFEGVGSFAGPPLAGLLYSLSESYTSAFYLSSALFFMAGAVMSLPILKFHKPEDMYSRSTSTMTTQTFDE